MAQQQPVSLNFRSPITSKGDMVSGDWVRSLSNLTARLQALLNGPTFTNGLLAARPAASSLANNSRYFATNGPQEYIVVYADPADPTTAAWTAI